MHTQSTSSTGQEGVDIVGARDFSSGPGPEIMAADTLEGDTVVNRQGETLGEIKHIMIDVPRGRVAYAVLSFGGILGSEISYLLFRGALLRSMRVTTTLSSMSPSSA